MAVRPHHGRLVCHRRVGVGPHCIAEVLPSWCRGLGRLQAAASNNILKSPLSSVSGLFEPQNTQRTEALAV